MKKSIITLSTLVLALVFFVGSAMAGPPSAKFAAAWSNDRFNVVSVADTDPGTENIDSLDVNFGYALATI